MPEHRRTRTILVIEDEPDILMLVSRILVLKGYNVLTAGDGYSGLEMVKNNHPDAIVMDMILPGIDGWSLLKEIKQDVKLADIPIIIFSGVTELSKRQKALDMGAVSYLVKPSGISILTEAIASALENKKTAANLPSIIG